MAKNATVKICKDCSRPFILLPWQDPKKYTFCPICHKAWRKEQAEKREQEANAKWEEKHKEETETFEQELRKFDPIELSDIPSSPNTLYIIGNGFDLMHGVKSSYYDFGKSLKRNDYLRDALEIALTPDDIWADFEESLGKINLDPMASRFLVDMWLETMGFYDGEDSAANFYAAVDAAATPIEAIATDLPPAFRRWVNRLKIGTDDRPLEVLINPHGKALSFNYTEFIQSLYHVDEACYIHGCRANKRDKLILGHRPDAEILPLSEKHREPRTYRQAVIDVAQDNVLRVIAEYNEDLTKDSREIIEEHREFFDSLSDTTQVVVIGHSLSPVDWDYFKEVQQTTPKASWFFGLHGLRDLNNVQNLTEELKLATYRVFRTDVIHTAKLPEIEHQVATAPEKAVTYIGKGVKAVASGKNLTIEQEGRVVFEIILPAIVRRAVFFGPHLIVKLNDIHKNVLLFSKNGEGWNFIARLKPTQNQDLINRRLQHIYMTNDEITFVYNNRVRAFDLHTGVVSWTKPMQGAKDRPFPGTDIYNDLMKLQGTAA